MGDSQLRITGDRKELIEKVLSHLEDEAKKDPAAYITSSNGNALAYYWCSVLIEESEQDASDAIVREGLEKSLQGLDRLDFHSSPEVFLDAVLRYARLHIKYKQWTDARNLLSLVDQLDAKPPGWVPNYLAKLLYETDPKFAYEHPEQVLDKLVAGASQPRYRQHSVNVFREFLESAREALEEGEVSADAGDVKRFKEKVQSYLTERSTRLLRGQVAAEVVPPALDSSIPGQEPLVRERIEDVQQEAEAQEYVALLESQVSELRARVADLEALVDELTTENIGLYGEVQQLREAYTELDEGSDDALERESPIAIDRLKILVIGGMQIKQKDIVGIVKRLGLEKRHIDFVDYDAAKTLQIESWRYNCPYDGILIGPVPHSSSGAGHYSSLVERLKNEEGFPPTNEARTEAGGLKITKSSFKSSMNTLLDKIGATDPELAGS